MIAREPDGIYLRLVELEPTLTDALGPGSSVLGSSHVIAAELEEVIDLIVG